MPQARPARQSRAERSRANRAAILEAARQVFGERGYHAATVEAVAEAAGFTIGAIYSRFDGKADLMLALAEDRTEALRIAVRRSAESLGPADDPADALVEWSRRSRADADWGLLLTEFRVHVLRHPELLDRYAAIHDRAIRGLAENLVIAYRHRAVIPESAALDAARAALALHAGVGIVRAIEEGAWPEAPYAETSRAMLDHFMEETHDVDHPAARPR